MKRKPDNLDIIHLTLHKIFSSVPNFETDAELIEFLEKDAKRPRAERIAEGGRLMEEAIKELENCEYLY
jgi:hypothetical protein